ncbi:acyl dehydratase [Halopolyspora algeriensis]|uniref:Acyl dehydratase n=1 Tax=Halopolyspora algeriensis TaxID=1500506 RepID=A0A368VVP2_9ACTN|nr:MaoC family dehydratase [Halopolyspora algeriensis]RCW45955.1 acyl dehydratase [Halopolyspora algeriensis]TQM55368.1 acyl dehydratase [Halopolyspora algeriensis]
MSTDTATNTTTLDTLAELRAFEGKSLGASSWFAIGQDRINTFADATDDHQWIHTDPERAQAESPFGGPIAHGYLTLSLIIPMWEEVLTVNSVTTKVNYGLNKVRFVNPVPADGRVRLNATLAQHEELPKGGVQVTVDATIELEGSERPACIAEAVYRMFE